MWQAKFYYLLYLKGKHLQIREKKDSHPNRKMAKARHEKAIHKRQTTEASECLIHEKSKKLIKMRNQFSPTNCLKF